MKDFYYQATELDYEGKADGPFNFDGYVKAEDRKSALKLAKKVINKENAWRKKHHEPVEDFPNLPPTRFKITYLNTKEPSPYD